MRILRRSVLSCPQAIAHTEPCQIAPLPIRVLRNLVGRFWGGAEEEGSSEDGSQREAELDGVD